MSNTALTAISVCLGICFIFFGTLKLAPIFSEELYRSMRKIFVKTYESFPLKNWVGWNPSPHVIRRVYGSVEVVGGILLLIGSSLLQDISAGGLLCLMLFNLFSIWNAQGDPKDASNSIVFGLLLTCWFVIRAQLVQNAQQTSAENYDAALKSEVRRRIGLLRKGLAEMQELSDRDNRTGNGDPVDEGGEVFHSAQDHVKKD
ncbi:Transmembrane protein 35A [Clonorchis sinensis]|uniref:Novel acetylcholine receptor chaperone n=1 Tax=Clonorchis sinensis TaxID=79923 RepID=A0A3R7CFQ6_CLOSI|nr:Transmembrane protein 35A [Clonorchis sinensis]